MYNLTYYSDFLGMMQILDRNETVY